MPLMSEQLPPIGQEVTFKRNDGVLLLGVRQENGVYTISLPDEDSTIDPAEISEWWITG